MKNHTRILTIILPGDEELSLSVGLKDRGHDVLKQLSELLGISDLHLFGLSVVKDNQPLFLDLEQKLSLYLPKSWRKNSATDKAILFLKVQYFVENAQLLVKSEALQLYFAEVKRRVLRSQCFDQEGLFFQLASYALQVDLGDCKKPHAQHFSPPAFFPLWVVGKRGNDFILQHTPGLHKELEGVSSSVAALLFIQEALSLSDVPLTSYQLFKNKGKTQGCVLLGLTSTGLEISEILNGDHQFLYSLTWSTIHSVTFQGSRFDIRADGLPEKKLVLYSHSMLHAKHLLQHISNSHRMHLNMKPFIKKLEEKQGPCRGTHREKFITDGEDLDFYESDDELPLMKIFSCQWPERATPGRGDVDDECAFEMSVDEPKEMIVDDPEDYMRFVKLWVGEPVDDPENILQFFKLVDSEFVYTL
ncbi:hypothetical protein DNTS_003094 [Danionella cerebrum]|uniref:FERM domain-containing protein n=1 Tax=Danionella cerebrum TaxID=2873325 RepID=A0A553NGR5_9TELE|nr:hypothetical protein DNTS_003094 [Danionella translucida]